MSSFGPTLLTTSGPAQAEAKAPISKAMGSYAAAWACAVQKFPNIKALIFDGRGPEQHFTFEELDLASNRLARNLMASHGVQAGDFVVSIMENRPELLILLLSLLKIGAVFVPLATDLRKEDCQRTAAMYSPKIVVCDQEGLGPFLTDDGSELQTISVPLCRTEDNMLKTMMAEGSSAPLEAPLYLPEEPCIIFSTSGSTGMPKGVIFSQETVGRLGDMVGFNSYSRPGEKHLLWVSMRGIGATLVMMSQLLDGISQVMVDTYPSGPSVWADLIDKHEVKSNLLFGAAMNQMLHELPNRTFPSVTRITYGGSCFAPSLVQKSMDQFPNAEFTQGYGITEAFPISLLGPEHHKRRSDTDVHPVDLGRMGSAGKPTGSEVFIEDLARPGSGAAPPPEKNGIGQICSKSQFSMMGYYKNPEKTKEAMPDGEFMRTGDVGRIDEDGFLQILGRVKEIIPAYRGFNVTPRDVEDRLFEHPAVGQAAVVGVPHPSGAGEAVVAWVSAKAGSQVSAQELCEFLESSRMPKWQLPDGIHVSKSSLPTVGGKLDKKELQNKSFRRQSLVELAMAAAASASTNSEEAETRASSDDEDLEELLNGLRMVKGCEMIFGACLPVAAAIHKLLQGSGAVPADGNDFLLKELPELVRAMPREDRRTFLLEGNSLIASGQGQRWEVMS
eukprot:TRINITY_DN61766_c0_g1_i1.p1 TRINITY_DN61766_c0_g1~~TRINITY_DN61766_c0_g1_i1.p1  ORF type:complete len:699 (+),score=115.73 TRINITY_DN61766_c0_g1_i1:83-2098(+)